MNVDTPANHLIRSFRLGPGPRRPRHRPEFTQPAERFRLKPVRLRIAYLAAVLLPLATAAAQIPLRLGHPRITGLVLVLPVLAVALAGSTWATLLAAALAGVGYDFFLTRPHYSLAIDDPDEVVALVVIIAVGAVVGVLSSRLARATARSAIRGDELGHLIAFVKATAKPATTEELADIAGGHIAAVLGADDWRWHPGYHGGGSATLLDTGGLIARLTDLPPNRAELPAHIEVPVGLGARELGRFTLRTTAGRLVSDEERRTAAAIATLLAVQAAPERHPTP